MIQTIFYLAIALTAFSMLGLLVAPFILKPSPEAHRIMTVVTSKRPDTRVVTGKEHAQNWILDLATTVRARFGMAENPRLRIRLEQAGIRDPRAKDLYLAAQLLSPIVFAVAGSFSPWNRLFSVFIGLVLGYMAPDFWLTHRQNKRKHVIRRSLPDALDLLVICVDAGLGFDQAMMRVSDELALSHPEINEEFQQVSLEQRAGKPRLEAWQTLADRMQVEEISSFVGMLIQADRFGTPIVRSLSRFSEELRLKRRQHAEEAAAKTKIKIIFPLVLCIFPCLFIVLLAPAVLQISAGMKAMGN
jgi:tight adherence protein C